MKHSYFLFIAVYSSGLTSLIWQEGVTHIHNVLVPVTYLICLGLCFVIERLESPKDINKK